MTDDDFRKLREMADDKIAGAHRNMHAALKATSMKLESTASAYTYVAGYLIGFKHATQGRAPQFATFEDGARFIELIEADDRFEHSEWKQRKDNSPCPTK